MMNTILISQKSAILLERLRSLGCSAEQLVNWIEQNNTKEFQKFNNDDYTFDTFLSYAKEHSEDIIGAIQKGYQISFNTMGGLRYWIEHTFGLKEDVDYIAEEGRKLGLCLTSQQIEKLRLSLAHNWVVVEYDGLVDIVAYSIWVEDNL